MSSLSGLPVGTPPTGGGRSTTMDVRCPLLYCYIHGTLHSLPSCRTPSPGSTGGVGVGNRRSRCVPTITPTPLWGSRIQPSVFHLRRHGPDSAGPGPSLRRGSRSTTLSSRTPVQTITTSPPSPRRRRGEGTGVRGGTRQGT